MGALKSRLLRLEQPEKAPTPNLFSVEGIRKSPAKRLQLLKAFCPISNNPSGREIVPFILEQLLNAFVPIIFNVAGKFKEPLKFADSIKALSAICWRFVGKV